MAEAIGMEGTIAAKSMAKVSAAPVSASDNAAANFAVPDFATQDFATLVRQHQSMVFSIALRYLRNRPAAEEVAQDVFLQLHSSLSSLQSNEHVLFWLRRVTCHRCIDFARRCKPAELSLDEAPEPASPPDSRDPLLARKLRQLVGTLPETPRLVMILRYQDDLDPTEIAEILTMPVATVRSHLHRSLGLLREKLTRLAGESR